MKYDKSQMTFVKKGWGSELWIVNNKDYCGKILTFEKGKKLSIHFHKQKRETFFVKKGKVLMSWFDLKEDEFEYLHEYMLFWFNNKKQVIELNEGDAFEIPRGRIHQVLALEDSEIYEFSTQHFDYDSYRIEKGD